MRNVKDRAYFKGHFKLISFNYSIMSWSDPKIAPENFITLFKVGQFWTLVVGQNWMPIDNQTVAVTTKTSPMTMRIEVAKRNFP